MSRTKISEWSSTAASNTDVGGVNIAEGCPPATINNAIREVMAQCNNWQSGASGDNQTNAGTLTSSGTLAVTGAFTLDGATGTSGQIMTSAGSGATPTWADKVDGVLAGFIQMYGAASAPTGWLLCDGSAVSRSTYATLFALIGTTYGAGDGSSTFNVPDLQDNVPIGKSGTKALASTGGANTVANSGNVGGSTANATISTAQMPSHSHIQKNSPGQGNPSTGAFLRQNYASGSNNNTNVSTHTDGSGTGHAHNMSATFSGSANSVLQPYLTVIYIIKT